MDSERITYYIKNGDRRIFNPGFSSGFIRLQEANQVRVVGINKNVDGQPEVEIRDGDPQGVSVDDIYSDALYMIPLSEQTGEFTLENIDDSSNLLNTIKYRTISCPIILDCDADRDGIVGYNEEGKANWTWGSNGRGAILMVNNDEDKSNQSPYSQNSEFAELLVRSTGYDKKTWAELGLELRLYATPLAVKRFAVYRVEDGKLDMVLPDNSPGNGCGERNISKELSCEGERLLVEAHQYPGQCPHASPGSHKEICPESQFEGLITIELHLRKKLEKTKGVLLASDRVVFRVAPWIMIPNTMPVKKIYAVHILIDKPVNTEFIKQLELTCKLLGVVLEVIWEGHTLFKRWIQDEIECGYSQVTNHHLPVVFASPNNDMKKNAEAENIPVNRGATMKNTDFGYFTMAGSRSPDNLDSFGNLEVSPPVTVRGKHYPLGRIIFGGRSYGSLASEVRKMMPKIRRFLYAQKVQSPIELFTDWLVVGHVDEIICFIPNSFPTPPGEKEFKVLLASPAKTLALLKTLRAQNHGGEVMFENKMDENDKSVQTTVNNLLNNVQLWKNNSVFQEYMNLNRAILTKHLDLNYNDFIDIPVLFRKSPNDRALAHFPNMINHLVIVQIKTDSTSQARILECTSIVPKPLGPKINDKYDCAFEEAFCKAMPKGHKCIFIDDWYSYHIERGEIHCGTNALRVPPLDVKWWHTLPDEGFNI